MKYTEETYEQLIRHSYGYSFNEQSQGGCPVVRALYEKNYLNSDGERKIPKKIHQIWLGSPFPDKYRKFSESWRKFHPNWEYKLWTDSDVEGFGMKNIALFRTAQNKGHKSDIFRYEILNRFGGLYIDTDFECLRSFDDLCYLDFFTGIAYDAKMGLYNGLIATIPHHPIIENCANSFTDTYNGHIWQVIMDLTGPYYFTRCFLKNVNRESSGVVAFPTDFFYPLPNNERYLTNPYSKIKPCSYAIHHWDVTWLIK